MAFPVLFLAFVSLVTLLSSAVAAAQEAALRGRAAPTVQELRSRLLSLLRIEEGEVAESSPEATLVQSQLSNIEVSLASSFQAMPKNAFGRLAPRTVHYVVQSYFAKEHGWQLKGLDGHTAAAAFASPSDSQEALVVRDAPAVLETLLESRHSDRGLSFEDVVAMVALLERLILDQSTDLLRAAYDVRGFNESEALDKALLSEILMSYMIMLRRPGLERSDHLEWLEDFALDRLESDNFLVKAADYTQEVVGSALYQQTSSTNPFVERTYGFESVSGLSDRLLYRFGRFQHEECQWMKESLQELDPSNSGLVPLGRFYEGQEEQGFSESESYLRDIGALDESSPRNPKVRIANYMLGPSNCISNSQYYAICCLDECRPLVSEIEASVKAPTATPDRLLRLVSSLSTSTTDQEGIGSTRELSADLKEKMHVIAEHHGGKVPIHGRLFMQWMHFAFPNECPYPHVSLKEEVSKVDSWADAGYHATTEEIHRHMSAANASGAAAGAASAAQDEQLPKITAQWTDDEVLPLLEPEPAAAGAVLGFSGFGSSHLLRSLAQLGLGAAVVRFALGGISSGLGALRGRADKADLPL